LKSSSTRGGTQEVFNVYIVGSTALAADWLSLTVGGAALSPASERIYIILTAGDYLNFQYRWDGSNYVAIGGGGSSAPDIAYPSISDFPTTGIITALYFALDTETFYSWNGSVYVPVGVDVPAGALTTDFTSGSGWNANTNTPTVVSYSGNAGDFAVVSVSGTTNINGINSWVAGDYIWWDDDNNQWQKIDNQTAPPPSLPPLTTDTIWIGGVGNIPEERETATSALFVGDYANDYPVLITGSAWTNNVTNVISGQLGDRAIGIDELGSISESFFTQYGWTRDFINSFITDATLIAALQTSGNWTAVSDVLSTYNAANGDRNQTYYANGIFYFCIGNVAHTWIRYGNLSSVEVTDPSYMPKPQIEVGKADNATFIIEAKHDILSIVVEAETTTAGNISIGSADGLTDIVSSTALPIVIGQKKQLVYIMDPNYPTDTNRTIHINIDSAASVQLTILTQKMFE
jgi:hypothetical protein